MLQVWKGKVTEEEKKGKRWKECTRGKGSEGDGRDGTRGKEVMEKRGTEQGSGGKARSKVEVE